VTGRGEQLKWWATTMGSDAVWAQRRRGPTICGMTEQERGGLRVSHEDRDQVAEALRVAAGDGRLTADELDERLERALTARTYDDLVPLLADLPAAGAALAAITRAPLPPAPAKDLVKIRCSSSSSERVGRWTVPARIEVRAHAGAVKLDFTEAVITQPTLHIEADLHSSTLTLVTRPGIAVEPDEIAAHAGAVKISEPWGDSVPTWMRITIGGTCRSSVIKAGPPTPPRPPRRTFWQWLRRAPRPRAITA
jgi:hypothetical protein